MSASGTKRTAQRTKINLLAPTSKKQRMLHNAREEVGLRTQRRLAKWSHSSYATGRAIQSRNVTGISLYSVTSQKRAF